MITYNGIVSYFKEFANKHSQINSFTEGELDQIDVLKINEYPVLHISISGLTIEENTIAYEVDAHIITGVNDNDNEARLNALSGMLLIMQDLRSEFYNGKYILNPRLLLRGDENISCSPIEDKFNNRVYGWTTSLTVTGVNESTICNIPYPKAGAGVNILEQWDGESFIPPFTEDFFFSDFYWWAATESMQDKLLYSGTKINTWTAFQDSNWLGQTTLTSNYASQTDGIQYNEEPQALRLKGDGDAYYFANYISSSTGYYYYFALKVKNIKSLDKQNTSLFQIYPSIQSGADGIKVFIGSPTSINESIRNRICISNWDESTITIGEDISDGGTDYIREGSLAFGLEVGGDDAGNGVKLILDGRTLMSQTISTSALSNVIIGDNRTGSDDTTSFDIQDFYAKQFDDAGTRTATFIKLVQWLQFRKEN